MRNLLVLLFVAGLVVAPSFGATNVQILANATVAANGDLVSGGTNNLTLNVGQTAVVRGFFVGNGPGVWAIGGNVAAAAVGADPLAGLTVSAFAFPTNFSGAFATIDPITGLPIPGTDIPPTTPIPGVNGAVAVIGSAQGIFPVVSFAATTYKSLFSYTVTATAAGKVALNWVEAPAGGFGGWYTTTTDSTNGIGTAAGLTITVNAVGPTITKTASTVDNAVAGKKTLWRTQKNVVRMTFSASIGTVGATIPNPGLVIQQMLPGGTYGPDLSANFTFKVEAGNVLRIFESTKVLGDKTWYAVRNTGGWAAVQNFTVQMPVLVGDVDGNGAVVGSSDIVAITQMLGKSVAPNDADRRDTDGNMVIVGSSDMPPATANIGKNVLAGAYAKPTGH